MTNSIILNASDGNPIRTNSIPVTDSNFLLIGDHAGWSIPSSLDNLGLSEADRSRHIALDMGVRDLGIALGIRLGAPFIWQHFSRLVCDCNRHPQAADWALRVSDNTLVPGNNGLREADLRARRQEIFDPYHAAITAAIDARRADGQSTFLISLHSFTPRMSGNDRPWDIGVLHDGHADQFARSVLTRLGSMSTYNIGDNQPYKMDDTDYTVPRHAYPLGLPYVELEVRQDRLSAEASVERIADLLGEVLPLAMSDHARA